ncbi:reticulon-4-interacting protein 1, mitochondrial precursor [Massarina eburnea CBS 473.64]|uniref:Reticulon-4-interacting protein 1, mitochondrial n=1 Tax=Massarina eburnea CBS 473.64 TaxID=1395130 RepID=A0A6A6RJC5_9PLEO|nr:reticulon-4-interacting protein 1, mitochondrial precursor [Massarina eburnea CBS 473.64]
MTNKMKCWQFHTTSTGLENTLFTPATGTPNPSIFPTQLLIQVHSAALNPADYKVAELGLLAKALVPSPSIPGMDFYGTVAATGKEVQGYQVGERVFGTRIASLGQGSLAEFVVVGVEMVTRAPEGVDGDELAGVGVAGLTAYQCIVGNVGEGDRVFVNGGSGGTGVFGIQIAKALGCWVLATCSTANVRLCEKLGADEVLDYTRVDVVREVEAMGRVFKLVVDNVGAPANLYRASHRFLVPDGRFCQVGAGFSLQQVAQMGSNMLLPGFLGGGKNKYEMVLAKPVSKHLAQIGRWMKEGKVRTVIDEVFEFENVPNAFRKLKTGRAKGKIIVHVK